MGWGNLDANEGKAARVSRHQWRHLLQQEMFDLRAKSRFAYPGRSEHQHKRSRSGAVNTVHEFIARHHQTRVRHGEIAKVIQTPDQMRCDRSDSIEGHQSSP